MANYNDTMNTLDSVENDISSIKEEVNSYLKMLETYNESDLEKLTNQTKYNLAYIEYIDKYIKDFNNRIDKLLRKNDKVNATSEKSKAKYFRLKDIEMPLVLVTFLIFLIMNIIYGHSIETTILSSLGSIPITITSIVLVKDTLHKKFNHKRINETKTINQKEIDVIRKAIDTLEKIKECHQLEYNTQLSKIKELNSHNNKIPSIELWVVDAKDECQKASKIKIIRKSKKYQKYYI